MKPITTIIFAALLTPFCYAHADDVVKKTKEVTKEAAQDVKKNVKKAANRVEEKACEMVNGTLKCLPKKAGNRLEEAADEVKDMAN